MAPSWLTRVLSKMRSRPVSRQRRKMLGQDRCLPGLECLSERIAPAITASFSPTAGVLSVFGDTLDNSITLSRNAAGTIQINGGAVAVTGGTPTVVNVSLIQVF